MKRILTAVALMGTSIGVAIAHEVDKEPKYETRVEKSVKVQMRDGIHLSMDLYMPVGAPGKLPTILMRTPYDKNQDWYRDSGLEMSLVEGVCRGHRGHARPIRIRGPIQTGDR